MKRILFPLLFLTLFPGSAPFVYPCSCADFSEREKFHKADYVFLGQVIEMSESHVEDFAYAITFKVEKQWKGSRMTEPIVNFDFDSPGWCGDLNLEKGKHFLIYAYRKKENLVSYTDCGPNLKMEYAAASIKKLNNPMYRFLARVYPF
jgi:hypothetical protein